METKPKKTKRPRQTDEEKKETSRARKRKYDSRRVYLGAAWDEWERQRQRKLEGYDSTVEWVQHLLAVNEARCHFMPKECQGEEKKSVRHDPVLFESFEDDSDEAETPYRPPRYPGLYPGAEVVLETPQKSQRECRAIDIPLNSPESQAGPSTVDNVESILQLAGDSPVLRVHGASTSTPRVVQVPHMRLEDISMSDIEVDPDQDRDSNCSSNDTDDDIDLEFDDPDWHCPLSSDSVRSSLGFTPLHMSPDEAVAEQKCIAFNACILKLVQVAVGEKCSKCEANLSFTEKMVATCLVVSWQCPVSKSHCTGKWSSQPWTAGMYAGNLLLPSSLVVSGNNYAKVALLAKFLKLGFVSKSSHYRIQRLYVYPAVERHWLDMQSCLLDKAEGPLVVAGDARNDSPGYSAQFCTYSLMDVETGNILAMSVIDVREAQGKSPNMEKLGFERALAKILLKVDVKELVTDAHPQIKALMKKTYAHILHQFDVWHVAKNMTKKIVAASIWF